MSKYSPTAEATRRAFIDSFCEIYKTKQVEKITVSEVTRKAGYNRATFYEYFLDIYDLLGQIENEAIEYIGSLVADTILSGNFGNIFINAFMDIQENAEKYPIIQLSGEPSSRFSVKLKKALMPITISAFHISSDDHRALYALDYYVSGIISVMVDWQENKQNLSVEELGELMHTLLTKGVLKAIGQ